MRAELNKRRRVDLSRYAASVFAPHLFCGSARASFGCGACSLALLTGVAPEVISARNGGRHYSDRFMCEFLIERKYQVQRLTPRLVRDIQSPINSDHVLLVSQLLTAEEGTWGVVFGELYYHNFQPYDLSAFAFLNKPLLSVYVVCHSKWRISYRKKKSPPKVAVPNRKNWVSLQNLRKDWLHSNLRSWS